LKTSSNKLITKSSKEPKNVNLML